MKGNGLDIGNWTSFESMLTWRDISDRTQTSSSHQKLIGFLKETVVGVSRKVLDIGCGNGRFVPVLASPDGRYVGVDNSSLIAEAGHKYPYIPHKQEYFRRDVTEGLDFLRDRRFDFVTMIFCLHFIHESKIMPIIKGLSDRLELNGQLIFVSSVTQSGFNRCVEHCIMDVSSKVEKTLSGGYVLIQGIK